MHRVPLVCALVASLVVVPTARAAQGAVDVESRGLYATRAALEVLVEQLQLAANSSGYSAGTRAEARADAQRIQQRLDEGDFQTGDQIYLVVEGETTLSDTFTVAPGPALDLPTVGSVPLRGVLRAELRDYLRTELNRFLRSPVVQVRTLIRISILGEVNTPGFYMVPTEGLITDVITGAGGPTREARLDDITIERQGEVLWESGPLQTAIIEGRTLDQLNVRAGDRISVPKRSRGFAGLEGPVRTMGFLLSIPLTIFAITQVF